MSDQLPSFSLLEHDLLCEMFNIGVGKASASLSKMVNQEVMFSVPTVELKTREGLAGELGKERPICSISQEMKGPFSAKSMLLFPADSGLLVVRAMLNTHVSDEMLAELQHEALSEIGNVVLNACIGSIADTLSNNFTVGLPVFDISKPDRLFHIKDSTENDVVLLIRIFMTLRESEVTGYLAFILGDISLKELRDNLDTILNSLSKR
jgi:chemotaxis protein CheC